MIFKIGLGKYLFLQNSGTVRPRLRVFLLGSQRCDNCRKTYKDMEIDAGEEAAAHYPPPLARKEL